MGCGELVRGEKKHQEGGTKLGGSWGRSAPRHPQPGQERWVSSCLQGKPVAVFLQAHGITPAHSDGNCIARGGLRVRKELSDAAPSSLNLAAPSVRVTAMFSAS